MAPLVTVLLVSLVAFADPAPAQSKGPFGGFRHDSSAKIEVTADSLQVIQKQNLAIFEGTVEAGQGTMRLTTDKLAVTYAESGSPTGEIQHMRAEGNVFLVNGAETAKGDWAEYDVAGGLIHMGGNVVLTQGDNAVAGQALEIDLNAGNARVTGRVTSIFQPKEKKN